MRSLRSSHHCAPLEIEFRLLVVIVGVTMMMVVVVVVMMVVDFNHHNLRLRHIGKCEAEE
jgi:hypothetical protein